jgi:hypothetical protein
MALPRKKLLGAKEMARLSSRYRICSKNSNQTLLTSCTLNIMKKSPIIFSMMALAGCSSTGTGTFMDHGVVKVNSYLYEVAATRSKGASTDLEDARQQVYSEANAFCAKQHQVVETDSLARFEEDIGRPASATLRFRCIEPDQPEPSHHAQS